MPPRAGRKAPDFRVLLPGNRTARRDDFLGRPLLLIFLRHLA